MPELHETWSVELDNPDQWMTRGYLEHVTFKKVDDRMVAEIATPKEAPPYWGQIWTHPDFELSDLKKIVVVARGESREGKEPKMSVNLLHHEGASWRGGEGKTLTGEFLRYEFNFPEDFEEGAKSEITETGGISLNVSRQTMAQIDRLEVWTPHPKPLLRRPIVQVGLGITGVAVATGFIGKLLNWW